MPYPSPFSSSYPVGAALHENGVAFRVWADTHKKVSVSIKNAKHELSPETNGYFYGHVAGAREGDTYTFFVDGEGPFPDPASRFQPQGPHGPSQITNPTTFSWTDHAWGGIKLHNQVIYELHVGTFAPEGTWRSAIQQLRELADLGITLLEMMPVAEYQGTFGWGYDGVDLFAPSRNYGSPDDFRAFVDAAHAQGIGVILDVVYNHLGPDGNYLSKFSENYFSQEKKTDWGAAVNFDGGKCEPVREFFLANAAYWIDEFHLDGLRLDATQNIYDSSKDHILAEICRTARKAAGGRNIIVVGENEPQNTKLIRPESAGGYGMDALWNDDFHHTAMVAATGSRESYYGDYLGSPQELLSATKYGFLFQGQRYMWQKGRRGSSTLGLSTAAMIAFLQNHDQVANSARGLRLDKLTTPGRYKALTALCLLSPSTPMLFQGQEFASSAPFLYFADLEPPLADQVLAGRAEFLDQWRSLSLRQLKYDVPCAPETFNKCKLDFSEREKHGEIYALHRDLLKLRKSEPVFSRQSHQMDGEILGPEAFVVRFFSEGYRDDRLLVVNLGIELRLNPAPMPLLAPPEDREWEVQWSTEDPRYGGNRTPPLDSDLNWIIPAQAAVVLRPVAKKVEQAAL
jgi:maltooligosyltrehalose trehalohydrolase